MKKQATKILTVALFMALTFITVDFESSWAQTEGAIANNAVSEAVKDVEKEMEFLYIESSELESPGTQNIAVLWDKDMSNITEFILVYSNNENIYELKESGRSEKSVLFSKKFSETDVGIYKIKGIKYLVENSEEEHYLQFNDLEISADFKVVNDYSSDIAEMVDNNAVTMSTNTSTLSSDVETLLETADVDYENDKDNIVIVIDPGHGGTHPGACRNGLIEKNLTLKISKYLKSELEEYCGVEVYMTRETDKNVGRNDDLELSDRVLYAANKNASLLVSIHINAGGGQGAEVWAPNKNYKPDLYEIGQEVSADIQKELVALGLVDRGVKIRDCTDNGRYPDNSLQDYYAIIRESKEAGFTGIIVEHAFIDNASDAAFLSSEENLKKLGVADATGIANYYGLVKGKWILEGSKWKYQYANGEFAVNKWINYKNDWYYIDEDGIMVTGHEVIGGKKYFFDEDGIMQTGWKQINDVWYYFNKDGDAKTGWFKSGKTWYYFNEEGEMSAGLKTVDGEKYYFDASGVMQIGWQQVDGIWYYFNKDGDAKTGWFKSGKVWYYFDEECEMATGIKTIGGNKYCFNSNGAMQTGWQQVDGTWYYLNSSGAAVMGWLRSGKVWYYLDDECEMVIGLVTIAGDKYYFNKSGAMKTGWIMTDGDWYYFKSSGAATKGWLKQSGVWYYLDDECEMLTGVQTISDKKYYFSSSGMMKTGWEKIDGEWYYFDSDGAMHYGWLQTGKTWYYLDSEGIMVTGQYSINGETYNFNSSGEWIQGYTISGKSETTVDQMVRYYQASGRTYPSSTYSSKGAATIEEFCRIYYEEAVSEGIKAEVAFCQAMKETGWLKFGGDVSASQCNFAGIGAVGGGAAGHAFKNVREGARGHIQHLKAYANKDPLVNECVDPRFSLVTRGVAPYVEWLGQKANPSGKGWAPAATYGTDIVEMIEVLFSK